MEKVEARLEGLEEVLSCSKRAFQERRWEEFWMYFNRAQGLIGQLAVDAASIHSAEVARNADTRFDGSQPNGDG